MIALLDGDLIAYRCAASAQNDGEEIAIVRADKLVQDILEAVNADTYRVFLSGENNFRKQLTPTYKANRTQEKPIYLERCKEFLVVEHKAEVTDGCEADDALGFSQNDETIICSLDKDLLQIPGEHYRWEISGSNKGVPWIKAAERLSITSLEGLQSFYRSTLIGDVSDNIVGVHKIGKVGASKIIDHLETEQEMFDACRNLYNDDDRFFLNLKLLWIWRSIDDVFNVEKRGINV